MRAVTLNDANRLEVREVPDPTPGPGELLVRVAACGICGSDLHMVESGLMAPGTILGHEVSGVVESGAGEFSSGDPVAVYPLEPCGVCEACAAGATGRCQAALGTTLGLGIRPGAFAEYVGVTPRMLRRLPRALPPELGALAEPLAVALRGFRRSRFEPGMSVGIVGCGPIGLCSVAVAKALGAGEVWACDPNAFRASLAKSAGADAAGSAAAQADIVVECAGARGTLDLAVGAVASGGQVVLLAVNMKDDLVHPFSWVVKEVEVISSLAHTFEQYEEAVELIGSGRVKLEPIITRRVALEETDEAFFALLQGAPEGKVLVTP